MDSAPYVRTQLHTQKLPDLNLIFLNIYAKYAKMHIENGLYRMRYYPFLICNFLAYLTYLTIYNIYMLEVHMFAYICIFLHISAYIQIAHNYHARI